MSSNARLLVEVAASLGTFQADMGKAAAVAETNAKKIQTAIGNAEAQVVSFSNKLVGLIGVPLGASAIIGTFKALEDAAVASERSVNQLNAVLAATGHAAGLTKGQLDALGSSVKDSSIFGTGDIRAAETALLRFRDIQGGVFKETLSASADVATVLGTTLPEAAVLLGKALSGEGTAGMRALKAAGVNLTEQQIDLANGFKEAGDKAGAMKVILDAVALSTGGAARANAQGLSGDLNKLSKAWAGLEKATAVSIFGNQSFVAKELTTSFEGLAFALTHFAEAEKITAGVVFDGVVPGGKYLRQLAGAAYDYLAGNKGKQDTGIRPINPKAADEAHAAAGAAAQAQAQADGVGLRKSSRRTCKRWLAQAHRFTLARCSRSARRSTLSKTRCLPAMRGARSQRRSITRTSVASARPTSMP